MIRPKIAFLCGSDSWGGLEMNIGKFALWLSEAGYSIHCFVIESSPLHDFLKNHEISISTISKHKKYFDFKNAQKLAKQIKEKNLDFLVIRDNRDIDLITWTKKLFLPQLKTIYFQAMQIGVSKKNFIHTFRYHQLNSWVSPLPWLAKQTKERTNINPKKIYQFPLAIDAKKFIQKNSTYLKEKLNLPVNTQLLAIIGRIDPQKGQLTVLEAFKKIHKKYPVHLAIIGDKTRGEAEQYFNQLKNFIALNGLEDKVTFFPHTQEICKYYSSIDILIVASKKETFGTVTIESLCAGCLTVGTNSGGTKELIKDKETGLLFTPEDADSLCTALTFALDNPKVIEEIKIKGQKEAIDQFDKTAFINNFSNLINQING